MRIRRAYVVGLLLVAVAHTENFGGKVDVVIMHGENVRYASLLKPRVIVKGGFISENA